MQTGICHIVGAGENYGINFEPGTKDLVIAVDAGFRLLEQKAVRIDLAIGDFDTLQYIPKHSNVIALKAEKDDTDMLAAVREGIRAGYSLFHIIAEREDVWTIPWPICRLRQHCHRRGGRDLLLTETVLSRR